MDLEEELINSPNRFYLIGANMFLSMGFDSTKLDVTFDYTIEFYIPKLV